MRFLREFSGVEILLFDSEWMLQWEKGEFEIQFRADGFNHFVCPKFSAHSHWEYVAADNKILIDWAQYGKYELIIDADSKSMTGNKVGQPTNWRKASFLRSLGAEEATSGVESHDHAHTHDH